MEAATCRAWVRVLALGLPLLVGPAGCISPTLSWKGDHFRHRKHDYTIGKPPPPWRQVEVKGAVLAFQGTGPDTMSLQSRCGRPVTSAQLMARHLLIGLPRRRLVAAGPVAVSGRNAWAQIVDTIQTGNVPVRLKTITLVARDCTFDWVLASGGGFDEAERAFDAWWATFQLGKRYDQEEE